MTTPHWGASLWKRCKYLVAGVLMASAAISNAQLVLTVTPTDQVGLAGETFTFSGVITNDTGAALQTTDLFLDFSNFDPVHLAPVQLLGVPLATIADGTSSAVLPLFTLTLSSAATFGPIYLADVSVQDVYGDVSDPVTVSVSVVPEPASAELLLVSLGLAACWVGLSRFRAR